MKTATVDNDLRDVLSVAVIDGPRVRLVGQLDRKQYERVNKVLESLGGTWNRSAKAHVFPSDDHAAAVAEAAETGQYIDPKLNGYFPTPTGLARQLVDMAAIAPGMSVLEPSAGRGALADLAAEIVGVGNVRCYEALPDNRAALREKGFPVDGSDFLDAESEPTFDRIVMNPPFQGRAYTKHILHAWDFLEPGGVIAAIAPVSIRTASDAATRRLWAVMDERNAVVIDNPDDAFATVGTNVRTVRFAMTKAG